MAKVKIKIEVNPNADDEELGNIQNQVNNTPSLENVSNVSVKIRGDGIYEEIPSNSGGINGLSLGYSLVFDENGYLDNADLEGGVLESTENPVDFVWGVVPENGEYTVRLTFTDAQSLKDITIFGDSEVNQFPTRAIIDGYKEITNDDLTWYINFGNEASTHTIEFTHWNKVNYNACLSKIGITLQYIEIDKTSGLKSVDSTSQSSTDTTGIFYGAVENRGSLEILDKTGELVDMLKDGIIDNSNTKLEIVANNETIQTHISTDSTYNANSQVMSLDLGNRLSSLDILKYKGYDYPDHSERLSVLFFDVLSNLRYALFGKDKELTQDEFREMLSAKYDATKTLYDYLYSTKVEYPFIESNKTYREVIDEFCLIAQMQMYIDDEDNVNFVSARPVYFEENLPAINIPKKNMFSQLDYAVVLKNKYDGVEAIKTNIIDITEPNSLCYTWNSNSENTTTIKSSEEIDINAGSFPSMSSSDLMVYSYSKIILNYYEVTISFDKKSNQNLIDILDVYDKVDFDNNPYIQYTVDYNLESGVLNFEYKDNVNVEDMFEPVYTKSEKGNSTPATYTDITISSPQSDAYRLIATLPDLTDLKTVEVTYTDKYSATLKVLVGYTKESGVVERDLTTGKFWYMGNQDMTIAEKYNPLRLNVNFYGVKREISFEEVQSNTPNIESKKTKVSLSSGNLIQGEIVNTIKNNILFDYKNGVSNATVSISCNDYFDENGEKAIDWAKGEIPKVNQILYFDNDLYADGNQRYWKIKGRTFRKTGVPMVDLELEESKLSIYNEWEYGLFNENNAQVYTWNQLLDNNLIQVVDKNLVKCDVSLTGALKIPPVIDSIESTAFLNCSLSDIEIAKTVTHIGYRAFSGSNSLKNITLPFALEYIDEGLFEGCSLLEKVYLPFNLKRIGAMAFMNCSSLKSIFIPLNVTYIPNYMNQTFYGCKNLTIYCEALSANSGWGEGWNIYDDENMLYCPVKYGYTFEQYKSEVGIK